METEILEDSKADEEDEKLNKELKRMKEAFEAVATGFVSASRGKRTEVVYPEFSPQDDYEGAEANCKCGWYGSADDTIRVQVDKAGNMGHTCPKCDEILWQEENY